jgi:hypothetical protein
MGKHQSVASFTVKSKAVFSKNFSGPQKTGVNTDKIGRSLLKPDEICG